MKTTALILLLWVSTNSLAQTCDPLVTAQQEKAKTEKIDADYEKKFDAPDFELQQKSGISDEQMTNVKMKAVLNDEVMGEHVTCRRT